MNRTSFPVRLAIGVLLLLASPLLNTPGLALPEGYRKTTIELNSPPVGLAFDTSGVLYAAENADFDSNVVTIRVIQPDGSFGTDLSVIGDAEDTFYIGSMIYDPITDGLLITDNSISSDGRLYAVNKSGTKELLASGIAGIAGVAVRSSGEIFVSTSPFNNPGEVLQLDRATGVGTPVVTGLGFGAGLAFDSSGDLFVQDANATTFAGRIQRLPINETSGGLTFGSLVPLIDGMQSSAGIVFDSEGDLFSTGSGGLFSVTGQPLSESLFDSDGSSYQFAAAIAFSEGSAPFEPFAGPDAGRMALMANFGSSSNSDTFVTLIEPLLGPNADFNGDSLVDATDLGTWQTNYGLTNSALLSQGDADGDQDVDGSDFLIWQRQYSAAAELTSTGAIPEPSTVLLMGSLLLVFLQTEKRVARERSQMLTK